jgi:pyruvate/2-oxoacid:ferredoxin oxidoreductase beta subunit
VNRKKYSVRKMCRALGIPQCSYYQWSKQETARAERKAREERLVQKVRDTFEENHRVYGCPKMQAALHDKGVEVKAPLVLDSKKPTIPVAEYIYTENRFKQLTRSNPEVAKKLADDLQKEVDARFAFYDAMSKDTEGLISL